MSAAVALPQRKLALIFLVNCANSNSHVSDRSHGVCRMSTQRCRTI